MLGCGQLLATSWLLQSLMLLCQMACVACIVHVAMWSECGKRLDAAARHLLHSLARLYHLP